MRLEDGFKETEIGSIPVEWEVVRLGELCQLDRENVEPRELPDMPYVGLEHIDSGEPRLQRWGSSNEVSSSKHHFVPGDVLYGKLRPYLDKAILAEFEGVCSTDILVVKANTEFTLPEFLVHILHTQQFLSYAISTTSGTNLPRTRWTSLRDFKLALPPLPEQRRIAHVLSIIQRAIAAQDALIAAARELKRSLMRHLFTYGPVPLDQAEQVPLKETEIGPVPEHWEVVQLGEIADIRGGTAFPHRYQGQNEGKYPFYKVSDMNLPGNETYMRTANNWVDEETAKILRAKPFPKNTVIFPKVGAAVHTNKKRFLTTDALVDNNVMGVTVHEDEQCQPGYLLYWFESIDIGQFSNPGPLPSITVQAVKKATFPFPPLDEQREIARLLQAVDRKIEAEKRRKAALEALFKTMLHQLMTGQVRV